MNLNWLRRSCALFMVASFAAVAGSAGTVMAQTDKGAPSARIVITASVKGSGAVPELQRKDVTVLLKGHPADTTSFQPLRGPDAGLQLVFLIDESTPPSLSLQFSSLRKFIEALPPTAEVAIAYMANGRAVMAQTLTTDHARAAKALRLPNSIPGVSGSPYFCLSDLAKHWPSKAKTGAETRAKTRRVVFMVTDGQDPYYGQADMQDPYVDAAISDAQKAGLLVYSIYFRQRGFGSRGSLGVLFGQSYLLKVSNQTGGEAYSEAMTTPVSFDPFLKKFKTSLENQYRITFAAKGSGLQRIKVKSNLPDVKLAAPTAVNVSPGE